MDDMAIWKSLAESYERASISLFTQAYSATTAVHKAAAMETAAYVMQGMRGAALDVVHKLEIEERVHG